MRTELVEVDAFDVPGGWVIGGTTRLLDSWSQAPLALWAPKFNYPAHSLAFSLGEQVKSAVTKKGSRLRSAQTEPVSLQTIGDERIVYDARFDATSNVAHILQNQLAIALMGLEAFGMSERYKDVIFIVDADTPPYALELFAAFGFETLATSDDVRGVHLSMEPSKLPRRMMAASYLRKHALHIGLLQDGDEGEPIFLSRRARRTLTNLDEIERMMNDAGYATLYAEDLSAKDQIRTIANASSITGIHGAAYGYAMLRDPNKHGVVVECFGCGYSSNWVRSICHTTGDTWIGGQGDLEISTLSDVLGSGHPRLHEAADFHLGRDTVAQLIRAANEAKAIGRRVEPDPIAASLDGAEVIVAQRGRNWNDSQIDRVKGVARLYAKRLVERVLKR